MEITQQSLSAYQRWFRQFRAPEKARMSVVSLPKKILVGIILLGITLSSHKIASAGDTAPRFNVQAQTACETEMLGKMEAHELFSGKAYVVATNVARAYRRPIPHIYTVPGSWNMAYIAGSTAVDGRGKILIGQQSIERFDTTALTGFLGHEMAHLVSDSVAEGCSDYILRDPQMEADADSLAVRMLGRRPVKAFLEQALALTEGQSWEVKLRLEMLQLNRVSDSNDQTRIR
jgi:Zn-dependent protease with chaperone function